MDRNLATLAPDDSGFVRSSFRLMKESSSTRPLEKVTASVSADSTETEVPNTEEWKERIRLSLTNLLSSSPYLLVEADETGALAVHNR